MRILLFALACLASIANAQVLVVKAGADGKVFEPSPLTLVSPVLTSPTMTTPTLGVATVTSINKLTLTAPATTATLTLAEGSSLITSGAYAVTLTATATTGVTLPTTGTLATLAGSETLSGKTLTAPVLNAAVFNPAVTDYSADGAIALTSGVATLSKTSAGAYTLAAPGAAGKRITLTTTTDFAHVVTFTGGTLWDGTAGANTTWTAAAVQGSSLTVISISATKWNVESFNLGTIAP